MSEIKSVRSGIIWASVDNFIKQIVQFIIGIILARILEPKEFGVLGILTIFLSLSELLIEGGFSQALIRKKTISKKQYSSVFYFNLGLSILIYLIIFLFSDFFERYFRIENLGLMIQVFMIKIVISSFYFVQVVILTKSLDFKVFTKITFFSSVFSGIVGIYLAFTGYGVWSLIWQSILVNVLTALFVNIYKFWLPNLNFYWQDIKDIYKTSSHLLGTSLLSRVSNETNAFIIGRYFSADSLGFYSRANSLKNLPSQTMNAIISKISLPILSNKQDNDVELSQLYKKILLNSLFVSTFIMVLMISVADELIIFLLGEKWSQSIVLFQYLSIIGIFYPLNAINNNLIIAKGKTKYTFSLSLFKFVTTIPVLVIGVFTNMNGLVIGLVIVSLLHTLIYGYYSGKMIGYSLPSQLYDFVKNVWYLILAGIIVYFVNLDFLDVFWNLFIKILLYFVIIIIVIVLLKSDIYYFIKKDLKDLK